MKLVNVLVELHSNREITINGRPWQEANIVTEVDEKVFLRQTTLQQKWAIICELQKLMAMLSYQYQVDRTIQNDLPATDFERMMRNKGENIGFGPVLPPTPRA